MYEVLPNLKNVNLNKFYDIFPNFRKKKKKGMIFHENRLQQTILMKYHTFLLILKGQQNLNFHLLQIIGGALMVN